MFYFVRSRYNKWNTEYETVGIFADKAEAEKFYNEEKERLGEDYDVILI
jgi:hypothetical protein